MRVLKIDHEKIMVWVFQITILFVQVGIFMIANWIFGDDVWIFISGSIFGSIMFYVGLKIGKNLFPDRKVI